MKALRCQGVTRELVYPIEELVKDSVLQKYASMLQDPYYQKNAPLRCMKYLVRGEGKRYKRDKMVVSLLQLFNKHGQQVTAFARNIVNILQCNQNAMGTQLCVLYAAQALLLDKPLVSNSDLMDIIQIKANLIRQMGGLVVVVSDYGHRANLPVQAIQKVVMTMVMKTVGGLLKLFVEVQNRSIDVYSLRASMSDMSLCLKQLEDYMPMVGMKAEDLHKIDMEIAQFFEAARAYQSKLHQLE